MLVPLADVLWSFGTPQHWPPSLLKPMLMAVLGQLDKGTFEPRDDETSRVVACGAALAALRHPTAIELSVSAAKGEAPPTRGQWEAIFNSL